MRSAAPPPAVSRSAALASAGLVAAAALGAIALRIGDVDRGEPPQAHLAPSMRLPAGAPAEAGPRSGARVAIPVDWTPRPVDAGRARTGTGMLVLRLDGRGDGADARDACRPGLAACGRAAPARTSVLRLPSATGAERRLADGSGYVGSVGTSH